ncbi:uncharacterized protein KRP23_6775 [Phytophthora ramorum]|uniref:uncharacterized protein n=1 Tax=Phytophthora ramorum TaxID=164328 RepID=UPI0030A663E5|nr:hypothetical protein KRP23_6775 [Phytophthora ramorum]
MTPDTLGLQRVPAHGRLLRTLVEAWECTQVGHRGMYTAPRVRALERYCLTVSRTRVLAVCLLTPLPVLGFVVVMELLPLSPPSDGWRRNSGWILRYVFVFCLLTFSCLQQASSFTTTLNVTLGQSLAIVWICVSSYFIVLLAIMAVWVFPIPFVFELTGGVFGGVFVVCVVVVFGGKTLKKTPKLSAQLRVIYNVSAVEAVLSRLPNAVYYPSMATASSLEFQESQINVAVYAVVQILSLIVFGEILSCHLQFPIMHQLAFVLETAATDVQAKLAMFIPYCFFFFLEHNGVDFSFRFAWIDRTEAPKNL